MKLNVYLDTSVFSAYHDARDPGRQAETVRFWGRMHTLNVCTSAVTRRELADTRDEALRTKLLALLAGIPELPVTEAALDLAERYILAGAFTRTMEDDAIHIAVAVLTRQDMLLSWNYNHLVNRRRRAQVNEVNVLASLPTIEIIVPSEI